MAWCSECGGEHREGAAACVFCGGTLVDVAPTPPVETSHEPVAVDISALDESQRSVLRLLLGSNDLHAGIVDDRVLVAGEDAVEVEALVQGLLEAEELDPDEPVDWSGPSADAPAPIESVDGRPVASTGVRLGAWLVDWLIIGGVVTLVDALARRLGWDFLADGWFVSAGISLVNVTLVGWFGWTFGKLVIGLRVVDADGDPPGWVPAAVRLAVMIGPSYLVSLTDSSFWPVSVVPVLAGVWLPVLLWTVATGPMHQGWHDRAARTYVVERTGRASTAEPDVTSGGRFP